jgi:hypothetical protein
MIVRFQKAEASVEVHACNPSTYKAEATLSQKRKKKKN